MSIGLSTRIGHLMGEGKVALAKKLTRACCAVTYAIIVIYVAIIYLMRAPIVGIFTSDPEVLRLTRSFWGYLALFILLDSSWYVAQFYFEYYYLILTLYTFQGGFKGGLLRVWDYKNTWPSQ